ncbi:adenosylcobinamide-phosphate synthase CbiB [Deinococcus sp. KNUC1210]|uniref:adenosylcobinamide-phosphate synthase CbiB n=1 Tax=Deinococcus sp. KNUC1210 TaxID=2917691 RepID=UPI001EEFA108|nr:adenosylcobinamide-phosphate synthase CbiB [Deinococcus sp. KNUC1210]ULH15700.1 adenosylcobinamide-phosphate synthase CbiB [Deinococcus sp. KNUC1210]
MKRRVMVLALLLDALGEPPPLLHPVVWMGNFLNWARRHWRAELPGARRIEGAAWWSAGALVAGSAGLGAARLPWPVQGVLLKPLLARRALLGAAGEVAGALAAENLPEARRLLAWHLVSRDTADLSASEVAAAVIESVSENLSDSVVAPLLAYRWGGLGAAALYRYANTADALWGYRTPELEDAGKCAARADDALNLLPSRLTAGCAALAAGLPGFAGRDAWTIWRSDARFTSSPNAGQPMSVFAGALGVRLEKRGHYVLNAAGRSPGTQDVWRALRLARWTLALAVGVLLLPARRRRRA